MPALNDGSEVPGDSDEWRRECLQRWKDAQPECDRHVRNLTRTSDREARRQYLERIPDEAMRERVKSEFVKAFAEAKKR